MKTLRFLIFALFVLSLALSAVPAQAAGDSLVYVALVTQPDSQVPLAVRAHREFQRLAPRLLSAQQAGYLIDFNTEFSVGIVMLRFAGGADVAADTATRMLGRPVYRDINEALWAVPRERQTGPVTTAIEAQFFINGYESCFWGNVPPNSHIVAILKDNLNVLQAKTRLDEDDDGSDDGAFFGCFDWSYYNQVVPGSRVIFRVYDDAGGTLLGVFGATAPVLTFTGLNKATAVVTGTGPAGKPFNLYWSQPRLNANNAWAENTVNGTISAAKKWSGDVSPGKIRGDAYISVSVPLTANVVFQHDMLASRIHCTLGGNFCDIQGFPYQAVTFKWTRGATTYTFSGRADSWGWFGVNLYNPAGIPIIIKAGDKVTGTNVPVYTLPALSLNAFDFPNDIISGKAVPSKFFSVGVQTDSTDDWEWFWAGSAANGVFSVDTTGDIDLDITEATEAEIWYVDPATGNITSAYRLHIQ
jgi:hypothetical protein